MNGLFDRLAAEGESGQESGRLSSLAFSGRSRLEGIVEVSGAKNAALPILAASLLCQGEVSIGRIPFLLDTLSMRDILLHFGVESEAVSPEDSLWRLRVGALKTTSAPEQSVRQMRAGILVLGPVLVRAKRAGTVRPGGCAIGARPLNLHLSALQNLGASVNESGDWIQVEAPKTGLTGGRIVFPFSSVGATETALMASCCARGDSVIENAATEPEITDLCGFLVRMGARIDGAGTRRIQVSGVDSLSGGDWQVIPDRIEAASYAFAALASDGRVALRGVDLSVFDNLSDVMTEAGARIESTENGICVSRSGDRLAAVDIRTSPWPGFPTDLQAQWMALMCVADGVSRITETVFENRFQHVAELTKMGARIELDGQGCAVVHGGQPLVGAAVRATDLRASFALIIAGICAEGETVISDIHHLHRGYAHVEEKLRPLLHSRREKAPRRPHKKA